MLGCFLICATYAAVELLDFIYRMCSLNLMPIALPDCPTYTLLHVLHFNLYIPLGMLDKDGEDQLD